MSQYLLTACFHQSELGFNEELRRVPNREPDEEECWAIDKLRAFNLADQELVDWDSSTYQDWYLDEAMNSILDEAGDEPEEPLEDFLEPPTPTPVSWPFPTGGYGFLY